MEWDTMRRLHNVPLRNGESKPEDATGGAPSEVRPISWICRKGPLPRTRDLRQLLLVGAGLRLRLHFVLQMVPRPP